MTQPLPDEITFSVWEENLPSGSKKARIRESDQDFSEPRIPLMLAKQYNEEEAMLAKLEWRDVATRYFVVKATTAFEEMSDG